MRESYFAGDVGAIVDALRQREAKENQLDVMLKAIECQLVELLDDERMPERQWRQSVALPLGSLAMVMRDVGTPTRSVEHLAAELSA